MLKFIILKQDSNVVISQFCLKQNQYVHFFFVIFFLFFKYTYFWGNFHFSFKISYHVKFIK